MLDNLHGIELVMRSVALAGETVLDEARVEAEAKILEQEVRAILDSVLMCGGGSVANGVVTAFQRGYLDIPFAPSVHNRGQVVTARDAEGAVRFLDVGNLQFDRGIREFHRDRMNDRRRAEGGVQDERSYLLVERDVLQIPRGEYVRWPLSP
jgi:methylaspartate mutase epsilon subunit